MWRSLYMGQEALKNVSARTQHDYQEIFLATSRYDKAVTSSRDMRCIEWEIGMNECSII